MPVEGRIYSIVVILLLLVLCTTVYGGSNDPISVVVSLDHDEISMDEAVLLSVVVSGGDQNLPRPHMPNLPMFEVYSQGQSSNISIVNGKVSASVNYRYLLMPTRPGKFPIQDIAVVYNNHRYVGNTVEISVRKSGAVPTQKKKTGVVDDTETGKPYYLEAVVDKKNPYVNEQVTLTLKFYIAVRYHRNPELTEPTTTGFWTELLGNKAPYRERVNGRTYRVIERKYALFPTQTGELTIGRATIRVAVDSKRKNYRDPFGMFGDMFDTGKEVSVRSLPVKVNVRPLPKEGRPADFTGTIGDFKISARVDKREVELNQPVTVTIKITGVGHVKAAAEPDIPDQDDFRIYRASSSENISKAQDRIGGTKIYEEVFIPKRPGTLTIPAINYTFFNPAEEKYKRVATRPIRINVTKPDGWTGSEEIPFTQSEVRISSDSRDIRYIKESPGDLVPMGEVILTSPLYIIVNGIPLFALMATILICKRQAKLSSDQSGARARKAGKMARKRLSSARALAKVSTASEYFAELHLTLTSYIADKLDMSPHGLTIDLITDLLSQRQAPESLIEEVASTLQRCDFARFASASVNQEDIDNALETVTELMIKLEGTKLA